MRSRDNACQDAAVERTEERVAVSSLVSAYARVCPFDLVVRNSRTCLLLVNHSVARTFLHPPKHTCVIARDNVVSRYAWSPSRPPTCTRVRSRTIPYMHFKDIGWPVGRAIKSNLIEFQACVRPVTRSPGQPTLASRNISAILPSEPMAMRWERRRVRPGFDIATNYSLMPAGMGFINIRQRLLHCIIDCLAIVLRTWYLAGRHVFTISALFRRVNWIYRTCVIIVRVTIRYNDRKFAHFMRVSFTSHNKIFALEK